jgi:putative acyl-CoA dehydrogenase
METRSRYLTEQMALALQACSLLATSVDNDNALLDIAHTFCESRLGNGSGLAFGTLHDTTPFERIIAIGQISYN